MSDKRHFTIVEGNKEHGLFISSTPSGAARKVVSKLSKGKKVTFSLREITQGSKKKVYGPYEGMKKKLSKPIKVGDRVYKYEPFVKKMKGGRQRGGEVFGLKGKEKNLPYLTVTYMYKQPNHPGKFYRFTVVKVVYPILVRKNNGSEVEEKTALFKFYSDEKHIEPQIHPLPLDNFIEELRKKFTFNPNGSKSLLKYYNLLSGLKFEAEKHTDLFHRHWKKFFEAIKQEEDKVLKSNLYVNEAAGVYKPSPDPRKQYSANLPERVKFPTPEEIEEYKILLSDPVYTRNSTKLGRVVIPNTSETIIRNNTNNKNNNNISLAKRNN